MNKAILSRPRILLVVRVIVIHNSKILLIQRSQNDSHESGKWEIPGGKLDKGQDLNNAAERELIEEAGIYARPLSKLSYYESDIDGSTKYKGLPYVRLVCLYQAESDKIRLSNEHDDYSWVNLDDALKMDLSDFSRKALLAWERELEKYLIH